jgi:hypothetical protein
VNIREQTRCERGEDKGTGRSKERKEETGNRITERDEGARKGRKKQGTE